MKHILNKSRINSIEWSRDILTIHFESGQITQYEQIPEGIFEGLRTAESPGAYIRLYIAPVFKNRQTISQPHWQEEIKKLRHFRDTLEGSWATDRPELIPENLKEKYFWEIEY